MGYRKIEVNGKEYEYVVGQANIKIKGVGVFPIAGNSDEFVLSEYSEEAGLGVTPKHIRHIIVQNTTGL